MYTASAGVWIESQYETIWQALCEQGQFVSLLPHIVEAKCLGNTLWGWLLGDQNQPIGQSIVAYKTNSPWHLQWASTEGLPTSGHIWLQNYCRGTFLYVEFKTFPVWRLGQLLPPKQSPQWMLKAALLAFAQTLYVPPKHLETGPGLAPLEATPFTGLEVPEKPQELARGLEPPTKT